MGQKKGFPPPYLVTSTREPRSPQLARQAAALLEQGRSLLVATDQAESVKLLDLVLLQLRLQSRNVTDAELKALCKVMAK